MLLYLLLLAFMKRLHRHSPKIQQARARRRHSPNDPIPSEALLLLAAQSGTFDWLNDAAEDIYTESDGMPAVWPTTKQRSSGEEASS